MRGRESNADRRAYETHGVSRHPHQAARVGIEPTEAWVRATLACQQTAAHRSPERPSCPTRTRTWDPRLNRAPLCRLSYRASCSSSGDSGAARDRTSPCRASTGRAACNASAPCRHVGRPGGTRTPAPRFVRPPRCRCATGRWSTREDLNLRPPRYQRGAHTGPGSWSIESGRRDSNPRFPAPKAGGMAASLQPVAYPPPDSNRDAPKDTAS